jgi:hypothetical protein
MKKSLIQLFLPEQKDKIDMRSMIKAPEYSQMQANIGVGQVNDRVKMALQMHNQPLSEPIVPTPKLMPNKKQKQINTTSGASKLIPFIDDAAMALTKLGFYKKSAMRLRDLARGAHESGKGKKLYEQLAIIANKHGHGRNFYSLLDKSEEFGMIEDHFKKQIAKRTDMIHPN